MKKIFFMYLLIILGFSQTFAGSLRNDMLPNGNTGGIGSESTGALTEVFVFAKDFLFSILAIIAIGAFMYFGFKIIVSRGNEEEYKKAMMGFLYVVIGLTIIPLAWGAVKIISTLKF